MKTIEIHPLDLAELLEKITTAVLVRGPITPDAQSQVLEIDGVRYHQNAMVPRMVVSSERADHTL